jgi:hypothetical protein
MQYHVTAFQHDRLHHQLKLTLRSCHYGHLVYVMKAPTPRRWWGKAKELGLHHPEELHQCWDDHRTWEERERCRNFAGIWLSAVLCLTPTSPLTESWHQTWIFLSLYIKWPQLKPTRGLPFSTGGWKTPRGPTCSRSHYDVKDTW